MISDIAIADFGLLIRSAMFQVNPGSDIRNPK
jgi:hypothetical protein